MTENITEPKIQEQPALPVETKPAKKPNYIIIALLFIMAFAFGVIILFSTVRSRLNPNKEVSTTGPQANITNEVEGPSPEESTSSSESDTITGPTDIDNEINKLDKSNWSSIENDFGDNALNDIQW